MKAGPEQRMDSLPAVPLTDEKLRPLLAKDKIISVWTPSTRSPVATAGGAIEHEGDILDFYIETEEAYIAVRYTSPDGERGGLAWYRAPVPTYKDEQAVVVIESDLEENYQRVGEGQ